MWLIQKLIVRRRATDFSWFCLERSKVETVGRNTREKDVADVHTSLLYLRSAGRTYCMCASSTQTYSISSVRQSIQRPKAKTPWQFALDRDHPITRVYRRPRKGHRVTILDDKVCCQIRVGDDRQVDEAIAYKTSTRNSWPCLSSPSLQCPAHAPRLPTTKLRIGMRLLNQAIL